MVRIIFILFLLFPCFCYGQEISYSEDDIQSPDFTVWTLGNEELMVCAVKKSANMTIRPLDQLFPKKNLKFIGNRDILIILEGKPVSNKGLNKMFEDGEITINDIESITILKNTSDLPLCSNNQAAILITLKPKYEAIILENGFDTFLSMQESEGFFQYEYLKNKNSLLVKEWNNRCSQPIIYNQHIYESRIDYNPKENYDKDVEYKLYMFFRFMEKKHNISLSSL